MPHSSPSDALRSNPCTGSGRAVYPTLYLDYGVDSVSGEDAACELCSRGMRFRSRWQFEIGALLKVAFTLTSSGAPERLEVEGMVVECSEECEGGPRLTTLAFIEPPESLQSTLGEVSARLFLPPPGSGK